MPILLPALVLLSLTAGPVRVVDADGDGPGPSLTLPGGPTIPMPPGAQVFGPDGFEPRAAEPSPAPAQPAIPPPMASSPPQPERSPSERRRARVDDLFKRLGDAKDETEANAVSAMLNRLWLQSGSDTADLLMSRAVTALEGKDYGTAELLLDKVVVLQPDWAEGWNKRATVRYLRDDDVGSMADIGRTLALEPRHFGALSGMATILHRNGQDRAALTVLRRAAGIDPQDGAVKSLIDQIAPDVDGHDI